MIRRQPVYLVMAALLLAFVTHPTSTFAGTKLFVPHFAFSDSEDTQFLLANQNDRDATVDLWAFRSNGEFLGQFQTPVKAHGTRTITIGEALQLKGTSVSGWLGATSGDEGIQLSYTRIAGSSEYFEAKPWASREISLTVTDSAKNVVRVSNPNAFAASLTITGSDEAGRYVGTQQVSVPAFRQVELPAASLAGGTASQFRIASNADVVALVDAPSKTPLPQMSADEPIQGSEPDSLALVIDSATSVGAYQVTLSFDPATAQFSPKDVDGGSAEGFESKPLIVNIDNAAGRMTLGSFQVGGHPNGQIAVARLRVPQGVRFGINVEEITDTLGSQLPGLPVGIVRTK